MRRIKVSNDTMIRTTITPAGSVFTGKIRGGNYTCPSRHFPPVGPARSRKFFDGGPPCLLLRIPERWFFHHGPVHERVPSSDLFWSRSLLNPRNAHMIPAPMIKTTTGGTSIVLSELRNLGSTSLQIALVRALSAAASISRSRVSRLVSARAASGSLE